MGVDGGGRPSAAGPRPHRLMALSAAALLAVYAVGYARTEPAARAIAKATAPEGSGQAAAAPPASDPPAASPPSSGTSAAPAYRDGTFTATGYGRHGPITVRVTVSGGRIASVAITSCGTTYPCSYVSGLPAEVVAAQSAQVDLVSGATDSSLAFQSAVQQALAEAQGPSSGTPGPSAGASAAIPAPAGGASAGTTSAPAYRDGTYTATGYGRHGPITVRVAVSGGRIASVAITSCGTTYPCSYVSGLPAEVVAAQSAQVDLVSGATDSSLAFQSAVQQALAEAEGQTAPAAPASTVYPGLGAYRHGGFGDYRHYGGRGF